MSARLRLIPLRADNADEMFQVLTAPEIYRFIPDQPPKSIEELRRRYQTLERGSSADGQEIWLNWIVRKEESKVAIGYVQATIAKQTETAQIAYVLNPKFWGQGFGREAVTEMLILLESEYNVRSFEAAVDWQNQRSIKLLQQLDFVKTGENATELASGAASRDVIFRYPVIQRKGW